ncbi:MAG: penicillin-binding protein 2 [Candidatus Omnitrophica bacterium]|nr:penicillin-binding protein 2 [Candidatus Omnitrophota bacterium]
MKIRSLHLLFAILFILLAGFLYYLQIFKGPAYKESSRKNSIRLLSIRAPRGVIYDRNGIITADNALAFSVFIVPQEAGDIDAEIKKISGILGASESLLKRNYKRNYRAPFAPCELMKNISKREAILLEESKLDMPGVVIKEFPLRRYIYKDALAHVLGYTGEIDKRELEILKSYGYSARDLIGKDGVEKIADEVLRGKSGGMQVQVDNRGRQVKVLNLKRPRRGKDVYLTIDAGLQNFIWKAMEKRKGAVVFMDIHTGEVLSLISSPSYDPNESIARMLSDKGMPLLNRAIMGQYPPGSLFKVAVALAGLDTGKIDQRTSFTCRGKLKVGNGTFHCWNRDGHGVVDLHRAVSESCNVYFYNVGLLLGVDEMDKYARNFGFSKKTGIELQGELGGFVPSRAWKKKEKGDSWYAGDTANLSIGQGYLLATPMQIGRFFACVANNGTLVEPHIFKRPGGSKYEGVELGLKKEHLRAVKQAMLDVVDNAAGTGFRAWSDEIAISAKTGTSQSGGGLKTHAWFAGFAPSDDPKISFVVFLEHGGSGGADAAIIAKKAVEYWNRNR